MATDSMSAFDIANVVDFQKRVLLLLAEYCITVLEESNSVESHDERAAYANLVLRNLRSEAERAAFLIVADNISAAAAVSTHDEFSDNTISTAIENSFNSMAGIFTPES